MAAIVKLPSGSWRDQVRRKGKYVTARFIRCRGVEQAVASPVNGLEQQSHGAQRHSGGIALFAGKCNHSHNDQSSQDQAYACAQAIRIQHGDDEEHE
jgi:hypothetical protein